MPGILQAILDGVTQRPSLLYILREEVLRFVEEEQDPLLAELDGTFPDNLKGILQGAGRFRSI